MQTLFSVNKIGIFIDTYHPVKEKRRDDEVMCIRMKCRVQPFDAKLATSIDDGLDVGVRGLLFNLNTTDPKPLIGGLKLKLDCPRQNIELFPTPDTDKSKLVLLQTKISGAYARDQKDIAGFAFCFDATHGPVDRATLEYIHSLVGKQVFATFEESEPSMEFSETESEDDEDEDHEPPPPTIFEDHDADEKAKESASERAAKEKTDQRHKEKAHRYPKRKAKAAKRGKR